MIRDPGPIQNLGYGVTSRDITTNEGDSDGIAPNSGIVTKALNGHPIMRFFASTAATMVAAGVASKLTKQGGLKLAKFLQQSSDEGSQISTRIVHSVNQIRKELDELQGVSRFAEPGKDPYSRLVWEQDGRLTTGYDGIKSERSGFGFLTAEERRAANGGFLSESPGTAATWAFKDELQQRLVRAGRRLPYELPAMYGVQKAITEPLFGGREEGQRKVKWYNPADVVSDFVKSSVNNIATMILPFEFAGAAANTARSSLHTLRYAQNDIRRLTPFQKKMHKNFVDVTEVLSEVGHDFTTLTNKFLKTSAQTSGALAEGARTFKNQTGFVQTLHSLRHGMKAAEDAAKLNNLTGLELNKAKYKTLFQGFSGGAVVKGMPIATDKTVFDLIPAFSGLGSARRAAVSEFKLLGKAYNAMDDAISRADAIKSMGGTPEAALSLDSAIKRIQSQHSSRFSRLAGGLRVMGAGGPDNSPLTRGEFYHGHRGDAFKDLLEQQIISHGVDANQASQFVNYLKVRSPKNNMNATNIITIGKTKIIEDGQDAVDLEVDYFAKLIKRYKGIKGGEVFGDALAPDALKRSVEDARSVFASKEFQRSLNNKINSNWNKFYRDDLHTIGSSILKPKKAVYQDFIGPQTSAKQDFLQRKTAGVLGIKLTNDRGKQVSSQIIQGELRNRGFDPNAFTDLRSFLIKNRQMTAGLNNGGYNIFGLQALTIDEARESGRFNYMRPEEQKIIGDLAGRMAINDPVSKSIGMSKIDGVYKTKSGQILDFTSIKSTFSRTANFFASEFKIPVLGFNPVDLFGYQSFSEMARRSPIQYVSSRTVQPFLKDNETRADFYMWFKTKGSKGKVLRFGTNEESGAIFSSVMNGTYRALPTNTTDLLTRHSRYAANMDGQTVNEVRGQSGSSFLNKLLRGDSAAIRFKRKMSIDAEQPNSLFSLASRFGRRARDPENPGVMAKLLSGEKVSYTQNGTKKTMSLRFDPDTNAISVIDDMGNAVSGIDEADVIRGYNSLKKQSFAFGLPEDVMKTLESKRSDLFTFGGRKVSDIRSGTDAVGFAQDVLDSIPLAKQKLRQAGVDTTFLSSSSSRIERLMNESNLNSISSMSSKSPTITTRLDELKNELFRYVSQMNQMQMGQNSHDIFTEMLTAVDDLVKSGVISKAQKTEAQAAALSNLFNISAFKTFKHAHTNIANARAGAAALYNATANQNLSEAFDPFVKGEVAQISGSIRKKFSPILAAKERRFGMADYSIDDLAVDPLGSGQSVTLVPTFGTVFGANPFGAIKSAIGLTTYSDPSSFSAGSIPISQGVERLNRYFGTLGGQLDVSDFKGPLDLFARGMVGKRVLPLYAAGTAALTVDRTIGGMINERDERGERVYSPFMLGQVAKGAVELQALSAGIAPGGMTYEEKKKQLVEGEVPIRQGRFWPLGNTPFQGGKVMYYRPSWYRKLQAGAMFTSDTYGSPAEKFLFYNDISPLRPFDPYRFERKHYQDRPYPVTGEYFSGPFGPLVPLANATIGKVLKPQQLMHEEETAQGLSNYVRAGQFGAYDASAYSGGAGMVGSISGALPGAAVGYGSSVGAGSGIASYNSQMAARAGSTNAIGRATRQTIGDINANYSSLAYGPPKVSRVMTPKVVSAGTPLLPSSTQFQAGEIGYKLQEMAGIYGFGFSTTRELFGFGQGDFEPQRSVLQSASKAYGTSRAFWDLNLGGLGDVPLPSKDAIGNIEFSEIVRRFIPKERTGIDYLNPIRNTMGMQYPFLPGSEYFTDFTRGDPFTKVQEGEIRLPGVAYERLNKMYGDATGKYGVVNQFDILADVAPYSQQFKKLNRQIDKLNLTADQRARVQEIRGQVEETTTKYDFSEYKYRNSSSEELGMNNIQFTAGRIGEYLAHSDNFIMNKVSGQRTALEDWERRNVYGATFPEWDRPFQSYIQPMLNKATQENPITAAASLGVVGSMFGRTPGATLFGTALGVTAGAAASTFGNISEAITGDRFIPQERKKELALEEYTDILTYVKNTRLANMARESGDGKAAVQFKMAAQRTMYGANIYGTDIETLSLAVPKRKREHFKAMLNAPEEDRSKILSTSGRLERRLYEAAWGMDVEKRPDLAEYFTRHELPDLAWEGWHPNTNMEHVKIKMGQSMGLEMSQMGYYPQQIREANLTNPSYPTFGDGGNRQDTLYKLRGLLNGYGFSGSVTPVMNPFGGQQIDVSAGVR